MDSPDQRNIGKDYGEGLKAYLKYIPAQLAAEQQARTQYDPQRIEQMLALEKQYDPNRAEVRGNFENDIKAGSSAGYDLDPRLEHEITQDLRGAQVARGNVYGNAPATAEAAVTARERQATHDRRLAQTGTYLGMPSVATPDRTAAYTPGFQQAGNLGVSFGQQAYQNQQNTPNVWAQGLALAGTAAKAYYGG